jgi:hypothetical protein
MKNEDFRKLLTTPRPGARPNLEAQAAAAEKQHKKPRAPRPPRPKPKDGEEGEGTDEEDEAARYRDRAAERRQGGELDAGGAATAPLAGVLGGAQGADLSHLTYDESKFLGGDVEHTHLVKGLDYALLNKVKSEAAAAQRGGGGGAAPGAAGGPAAAGQESRDGAGGAAAPRAASIKTALGRGVHDFFFGPQRRLSRAALADQFLPRRTAFLFELDDPAAPDVPTTLRRSKEDCPAVRERMTAGVDASVLERMAKIIAYMSLSSECA